MKFLLDTNFLLIPGRHKARIFEQLQHVGLPELYTLRAVVAELEELAHGSGKLARAAKLGLTLIEQQPVTILPAKGPADAALLRKAREGFVICTQDRALLRQLKARGLRAVFLRQRRLVQSL